MACWMPMQEETLCKGPWLEEEDEQLATFVTLLGQRRWDFIARVSGLKRSGKSCRLRWMNYLLPDLKHGQMSAEEENIIFQLHECWGNKWSKIAWKLPGRTDNEIKNYWRTHLRKKALAQEQENFQREIDNATRSQKDYFQEEGDRSTQTTSFEHCGSVEENVFGLSGVSFNAFGLSDHEFASSPYETQLSDCISGLPDDQSELKHHGECNLLDSWLSYPKWTSKNGDSM